MSGAPVRTGSLHRRVVLAALAVLLAVLVGLGFTVNYLLGERMRSDLRQRLADRALYAQELERQGIAGQTLTDQLTGQGISASLVSGGQTVYGRDKPRPPAPPGAPGKPRPPHSAAGTPVPISTEGNSLSVALDANGGTLRLQASDAEVSHTLGMLRGIEAVVGLVTMAIAALLLTRAVGIALSPLRQMSSLARSIAGGARGQRLRPTKPDTDIGRTAVAFDGMLDELESAEAGAREAENRMRQFLADVSHDLRTPLAGMIASAETLLRANPARPEREARLVDLVREGARASRLVDDLLLVARLDTRAGDLAPRPVDLVTLAHTSVAAVAQRRGDLQVSVRRPDHPAVVVGDADQLRRAIGNLRDNAVSATPPGGEVTVHFGFAADAVAITVTDTGLGVAAADAERIFDRFVSGDASRSGGGSGLGLPIARAIARAHGGDVRCVPVVQGARFDVVLPSTAAPRRLVEDVAHPVRARRSSGLGGLTDGLVELVGDPDPKQR